MRKTILFALPLLLCGCKDEVNPAEYGGTIPLTTPVVSIDSIEYNYLGFSWSPVSDAVEYGYRLENASGKVIDGGLTAKTQIGIEDLDFRSIYTLSVWAYPTIGNAKDQTTSAPATVTATTPFFSIIEGTQGTYTSAILTTTTWEPVLNEVRTADDSDYGTFTLAAWYNHEDYDLVFRVNYADSTIQVLNGTPDEATGMVKVLAGPTTGIKTNQYVRQGVLIDESRCRFDRLGHELRIWARSTKDAKREGLDVFDFN